MAALSQKLRRSVMDLFSSKPLPDAAWPNHEFRETVQLMVVKGHHCSLNYYPIKETEIAFRLVYNHNIEPWAQAARLKDRVPALPGPPETGKQTSEPGKSP